MRDVAAALLTVGEATTPRALASLRTQTLPVEELVTVEGVTPFSRALNTAAERVRAPFFVQVDADMVLEPTCFERLRDAMGPDVGIAVGSLRDPLGERIAGVKMFRRECFDRVRLRHRLAPEVDFYLRLGELGWRTAYLTGDPLGAHAPDYTPDYVFGAYYLLGVRYARRRDVRGLRWRIRKLRDSAHSLAPVARVAMGHGVFGRESRDVARPRPSKADARFLHELGSGERGHPPADRLGELMQLGPRPLFDSFRQLGASLRSSSPAGVVACLHAVARHDHDNSLLAEAGLGHGALAGTASPVRHASLAWLG
ncbi:MAG: hypothetical protein ACJ766_01980 [Thermoleophilaceae bacterium]